MSHFNAGEFIRQLKALRGLGSTTLTNGFRAQSPLIETPDFGANPGGLKMFSFLPADLGPKSPLVVVLHGCTQTASGYDVGTGWSTLADRYGFALLMPEQQRTNNANGCFSWFNPEDCERGMGEACSIREMIALMTTKNSIDNDRIFITGLSAGGAMTSVMLATYPEVFAGGAIIAGLPFGAASNVQEALNGMRQTAPLEASELGDMVRSASRHSGPWPKVSVWHGDRDLTVNPSNSDAILKQWLDVHGLPTTPMAVDKVDGHKHAIWWNAEGETIVEFFTIAAMAHGAPLGLSESDEYFGASGPFLIDAGISSTYHIATFFALTERVHRAKSADTRVLMPSTDVKVAWRETRSDTDHPYRQFSKIDVGAVITKALIAAGLMGK